MGRRREPQKGSQAAVRSCEHLRESTIKTRAAEQHIGKLWSKRQSPGNISVKNRNGSCYAPKSFELIANRFARLPAKNTWITGEGNEGLKLSKPSES